MSVSAYPSRKVTALASIDVDVLLSSEPNATPSSSATIRNGNAESNVPELIIVSSIDLSIFKNRLVDCASALIVWHRNSAVKRHATERKVQVMDLNIMICRL